MQKLGKKASILLWAIFLSMTLIIAFTSINYQLRQNLAENNSLISKIREKNEKISAMNNAIKNDDFSEIELPNNEKIVWQSDNIIQKGLKSKEEEINLKMLGGTGSNITIKILEGGPIYYSNSSVEGLVVKESTFNTQIGEINIANLGGYSNLIITSENKFENSTKKYKIITNYGTRTTLKENGEITIK